MSVRISRVILVAHWNPRQDSISELNAAGRCTLGISARSWYARPGLVLSSARSHMGIRSLFFLPDSVIVESAIYEKNFVNYFVFPQSS